MRVVPSDAMFPTISMSSAGAVTTGAETYGTEVSAGTGTIFVLYPIDGDSSTGRSVEVAGVHDENIAEWTASNPYVKGELISHPYWTRFGWYREAREDHTSGTELDWSKWQWTRLKVLPQRFRLVFYDTDPDGNEYKLEEHSVSLNPNAKDELGRDAFISIALERDSIRFRCVWNESETDWVTISGFLSAMAKTTFTGGTNGTLTDITTQDWTDAWDVFKAGEVPCDLLFMAGNRDPDVISYAAGVAQQRRGRLFADLDPNGTFLMNSKLSFAFMESFRLCCPISYWTSLTKSWTNAVCGLSAGRMISLTFVRRKTPCLG